MFICVYINIYTHTEGVRHDTHQKPHGACDVLEQHCADSDWLGTQAPQGQTRAAIVLAGCIAGVLQYEDLANAVQARSRAQPSIANIVVKDGVKVFGCVPEREEDTGARKRERTKDRKRKDRERKGERTRERERQRGRKRGKKRKGGRRRESEK